ncbi:Helicase conserved domain protein [Theileria parva strain Muguga]|uniref:RNA helicase n=1 Tax=Theileria parva TaxID=5875 RepID=Q4N6K5_THEPA|nr:Helicase conserved domain protein [Theileria parva strain Muguga]EAN34403.1 Helicase conserved domain protein [Theileria parva strain Muguga]|eukprot:XP_766686.1 ATP-dependent DEAD box helicase [Theileria parva strain Muguga]
MLLYRRVFCNLKTFGRCFTTFEKEYDKCYNLLPFTQKEKILVNNAIINLANTCNISNFDQNLRIPLFFIKNSDFRNSLISYLDKSNDFKSFFRQNLALLNENNFDEDLHLDFLKFIETFIKDNFPNVFITFNNLKHFSDFSKISNLYHNYTNFSNNTSGLCSNDVTIGRNVYLHVGPPNSGKTHDSIKALLSSGSGIYCAPLRLLAWEMFNTINNSGVKCSLLTGQELVDNGEPHVSCTVEMIPFERTFEVAVLDEMQMVGDLTRGYSWTKAFLSLNVPELHICGSKSCISITANLANIRGDKLEIFEHERLCNLKVMDKAVGLSELEPGDCVVCFSRYDAFNLRNIIESTKYSWNTLSKEECVTSIVYGLLPPETRYDQIERFNKGLTRVLVASDVIGMGVNVSIRRVIFYRLTKFDGNVSRPLTVSEVHQIAGRAGRFGISSEGFVSCVREQDLPTLREVMAQEVTQIEKAVISPPLDTIGAFYSSLKHFTGEQHSLLNITKLIGSIGRVGQGFMMCDFAQINSVSRCLEGINLPFDILKEYLMVPMGSTLVSLIVRAFAASHSLLNSVKISNIIQADFLAHNTTNSSNLNDNLDNNLDNNLDDNLDNNLCKNSEIKRLELLYEVLDIYVWLSNKFPVVYIDKTPVKELKSSLAKTLSKLVREPNEVIHEDENDLNIVKNILRPEFNN